MGEGGLPRQRLAWKPLIWKRKTRLHGARLYGLWVHLRRRCVSPSHRRFRFFGKQRIRWARAWDDFDAFCDALLALTAATVWVSLHDLGASTPRSRSRSPRPRPRW